MHRLIANGHLVDLILGLMLLEAGLLLAWRRLRGGGIAPLDLLGNLAAGAALLLALRIALTGGSEVALALALAASLLGHLFDLARRWRAEPARRRNAVDERPTRSPLTATGAQPEAL